jgi:hypothetical protein
MKYSVLVAVIAVLGISACTDTSRRIANEAEAIELRVMTFNIEWGGTNVSFDNVVKAIRLSDADIVGIQEAEGNLARLAAELDWHYGSAQRRSTIRLCGSASGQSGRIGECASPIGSVRRGTDS